MYRVFLSSTSRDLAAHREAVLAAIGRMDGFAAIAMETFGARASSALDFDDRKIRESDVLVGVLGLCYGSSPRDGPPSFTECEYHAAIAAGVDRLIAVSPDGFPVPGDLIEPDEQRQRQQAFRVRAKADLIVEASAAAFASPEALASAVISALANWRAERERVDVIVAELVAAKEQAARHEARAGELERALEEGQKEREALRAAVQALTEKAREPVAPPTIDHALALLPEGKTVEAEAIFAEIVTQKAAEGRRKQAEGAKDLREAAEAARHLGALTFLYDTAKALQAYKTATEFDPDHTWSWIFLGRLHIRAGNLASAEQEFQQARAAAERSGDERDVMAADASLGDVRKALGDLGGAMTAYEAASAIAQSATGRDPDNAARQRDLSVAQEKIGNVLRAQGDLGAALQTYEASLAIRRRLAAADPGDARWQYDLGISNERIGDVLVAQGNLADALTAYECKHHVIAALVDKDPANADWQRDLSVSLSKIGDVRVAQGDRAGALEAYEQGRAITENLAGRDPANAGWQRDLSVSFNKIGDVQSARGNLDSALKAHQDGLAIAEKLAAQDPGNADWQRDLALSLAASPSSTLSRVSASVR